MATVNDEGGSSSEAKDGISDQTKSIKQEEQTESPVNDTIESDTMSLQDKVASFLEALRMWHFGLAGGVLAIVLGSNNFGRYLCRLGFEFCLRVLSWAIGIALGVGWATHVYEQLDLWQARQTEEDRKTASVSFSSNLESTKPLLHASSSRLAGSTTAGGSRGRIHTLEDEQTYASLMAAAGYKRRSVLRGQVIRKDQPFWETQYPLVDGSVGAETMNEQWGSTLPDCIQQSLSKWTEYIIRDFVASWYQSIDAGVKVKLPLQEDDEDSEKTSSACSKTGNDEGVSERSSRAMVYTLAGHGGIPFLDSLYECMGMIFGNMATRMEHVNIFQVVLIKWTKALAHTFKTYRQLRTHLTHKHHAHSKLLKKKKSDEEGNTSEDDLPDHLHDDENGIEVEYHNPNNERRSKRRIYDSEIPVSEMSMVKEFLLAGKLHKATTFGLDVPSLLFADGTGRECGVPLDESVQATEEAVLEHRLFKTGLLRECEQDYNRVVANRMVRVLMSRADFGSPVVSSLLTEIMGSCVLTPIMQLMDPAFINGWILMGLNSASSGNSDTATATDDDELEDQQCGDSDDDLQMGDTSVATEATTTASNSNSFLHEDDTTTSEIAGSSSPGKERDDFLESDIDLIAELEEALDELESHIDLEGLKSTKAGGIFDNAEWNDKECRAAVLHLVLVVEAALLDGRCVRRKTGPEFLDDSSSDQSVNIDGDTDSENEASEGMMMKPNGEDDIYVENSLGQLLMTLTGDVEAFEERVARENTEAAMLDEGADIYKHFVAEPYTTTATERSTIRTLICAWLHSGKIHNIVTIIVQAHATILSQFYLEDAFLRSLTDASDFVRLLGRLDRVDVLVDTMEAIGSPPLTKATLKTKTQRAKPKKAIVGEGTVDEKKEEKSIKMEGNFSISTNQALNTSSNYLVNSSSSQVLLSSAIPRHLDFHRNEAFAASLRSERERRMQSWIGHLQESGNLRDLEDGIVSHYENDLIHKELHHLAKVFYNGTNLIAIRDASRRKIPTDVGVAHTEEKSTEENEDSSPNEDLLSLITVEIACPRRRIEVPDDDSSFLLRAQPRPLAAVGVHRDQRNHDQSFRCFAGTFEEPLLNPVSGHFAGGRFIRRCLIR